MAANPPPAPPPPKKGPAAGLTRKIGPLPVWAWAIIGLAVGYYVYEHYLKGATAATSPTANTVPATDQSAGGASSGGGIGDQTATTPETTNTVVDPNAGQNAAPNAASTPDWSAGTSSNPVQNVLNSTAGQADGVSNLQKFAASHPTIPASSGALNIAAFSTAGHGL